MKTVYTQSFGESDMQKAFGSPREVFDSPHWLLG